MKQLSSIEKWTNDFEKNPLDALDRLLFKRVYMGRLNRNGTPEIIFQLFSNQSSQIKNILDLSIKDWFAKYRGLSKVSVSSSIWATILQNAFLTVSYMGLKETHKWLANSVSEFRLWLRSIYNGPSRDPEDSFLRTLAYPQNNQSLLPTWNGLCKMQEDVPLNYASIGLLGLRKLPDENGKPNGDLHPALFNGIVDLAGAINNQYSHNQKKGRMFWELECRAIMSRYPRSTEYWTNHFLPLIIDRTISREWLCRIVPGLSKRLNSGRKRASQYIPQHPSFDEYGIILKSIKNCAFEQINLEEFIKKYRIYTQHTGDSEPLAKTYCDIGNRIYKQDADLALSLVNEALIWEPYNPFIRTIKSKIQAYKGDYSRAQAVLWEAKRNFPEEPRIRNMLGNLLRKQSRYDLAKIVYEQAGKDFPNDAVCRTGLAEVLRDQEKPEEAEKVYRQAGKDFPQNAVCRTGLAEVLRDQGKSEEAEKVYRQAGKDFPNDEVCRTGLKSVLYELKKQKELINIPEQKKETENKSLKQTSSEKFIHEPKRPPLYRLSATAPVLGISDVKRPYLYKKKKSDLQLNSNGERPACISIKKPGKRDASSSKPEIIKDESKDIETKTGIAALLRDAVRWTTQENKKEYQDKAFSTLNKVLEESPENIPANLEKGWLLADLEPNQAEDFFSQQIETRQNVAGFHIGYLRAKSINGKSIESDQWNRLINNFPGRSTSIWLEETMRQIDTKDEKLIIVSLERLRKQINKPKNKLPISTQKNQDWVALSVKQNLFDNIDTDSPFTKTVFPAVLENQRKNRDILKGTVEQSLCAMI
jgi:tetratricopeptide (TPR) repeat protein